MVVTKEKDPEEMLSATDAGKILGVSGKSMTRYRELGYFPGYSIGGTWKFMRRDIENYRDAQKFQGQKSDDAPNGDSLPLVA
jgi:hypothetical protein